MTEKNVIFHWSWTFNQWLNSFHLSLFKGSENRCFVSFILSYMIRKVFFMKNLEILISDNWTKSRYIHIPYAMKCPLMTEADILELVLGNLLGLLGSKITMKVEKPFPSESKSEKLRKKKYSSDDNSINIFTDLWLYDKSMFLNKIFRSDTKIAIILKRLQI